MSGAAKPSLGGTAVLDSAVGAAAEIVATRGKPRSNLGQIRAEISGGSPGGQFHSRLLGSAGIQFKTNNEINRLLD